jgi:PAS domain-containing protein
VVLLEVFAILLLACAVAAEYIGAIFERLNANIVLAGNEVELGQKAWADLIERLPLPALLVDPYTLRIAACSRLASTYLHAGDPPLEGRSVLEVLRPSFPDVIQDLVNGVADEAPITAIRVADQLRVTQMSVQHLAHKERRLALLTITDRTEAFCMKAALDASDHATLVIDVRGSVMAFNRLARDLFAGVAVGADAAHLLEPSDPALRWWDPGLTGRRKMHIQIGQHVFQIISSSIALAGEEERIFAVALLPVANAADAERSAAGGAVITRFRGRP